MNPERDSPVDFAAASILRRTDLGQKATDVGL